MTRRYPLLVLLTLLLIGITVFGGVNEFKAPGLPLVITLTDADHATLEPVEGVALPAGVNAGDRLDLRLQPPATRTAISIMVVSATFYGILPLGRTYAFVISRDQGLVTVPVTTGDLSQARHLLFIQWLVFIFNVFTAGLALLTLWRGRGRAAAGMALWTVSLTLGADILYPQDGAAGVVLQVAGNLMFLMARVGFFVMADAIARPILKAKTRALFLTAFIVILLAGAVLSTLGGPIFYILWSWGGGLTPLAGLMWTASYLVPGVLLLAAYRGATLAQRLRLRWMLVSSGVFFFGIFLSNTPVLGVVTSLLGNDVCSLLGIAGFLYAVLRHRVVDVSVLLDGTLVYGALTALVVGVLAMVNSVVERAALGTSASLVLQVAVPLSLGIVLTRVRAYLDRNVERVFFRKKYEADRALRQFAKLCPGYEGADELMSVGIASIGKYLGARGVAVYARSDLGYQCLRQAGEVTYPPRLKVDDMAFVAARSGVDDVDLGRLESALGTDGVVFPMAAHGELKAVLVCANRPGEHYSLDERRLLLHVALEMGQALYALEMQVKAKIVGALLATPAERLAEVQRTAFALLGPAAAAAPP